MKKKKSLIVFLLFFVVEVCVPRLTNAQKISTGTVINAADKTPVTGASVTLNATAKGTVTDEKGNFTLSVKEGDILHVSFVGFEPYDFTVASLAGNISIALQPSASKLNDVVVVAYGTQKKANLTGAVSSVGAAQLENRPVTSITNALQGAASGVTIVSSNGQPGKDAGSINIRGIGTLNNSSPMVVVDGVISTMGDVNPDDVESISILKDAASASIYGSRAANGVILITTKKGKKGTTAVHYSGYVGKQSATELPDFLPSWQSATLYDEAQLNTNPLNTPVYSATDIQKFKDGSDPYGHPNTDWLGLFYNGSGLQQNHYVDVSGGTDKSQYMFSLGYFDQDGITKKTNAQRYTARLNLTSKLNSRLTAFANIAYSYSPLTEPQSSFPNVPDFSQVIRQINRISPTVPYKYANGFYGYIADGSPMAWMESPSVNKQNAYKLFGTAGLDLEIIKDLHFRPSLGYRSNQDQNKAFVADIQYYDHNTGLPALYQGPNNVTDKYDNSTVVTLQALFDYTKKIGGHTIKVLAGYSQEYTKYYQLIGYKQSFQNNSLTDLNAASSTGQTATGFTDELALQSFFGRINYDYKGKYLLEANLRYDGSSRFDTSNRWGAFPSLSAAWRISEEDFFSQLKSWISNLKIRGSWGKLGNQTTKALPARTGYRTDDNYPYITTINAGQNYVFGNTVSAGVAPINGANPGIQWENTTETDIGLDAGFMKEKVTITADYFVKTTKKILLSIPVAAPYGLIAPTQNAAIVQNKGLEMNIGYRDKTGDFTYNISGNVAFISNKVTNLVNTGPYISGVAIQQVGLPINSIYGYQAEGLFQTQKQVDDHAKQSGGTIAPGDIMYKDQNGDGIIDAKDRVYLGNYFPKIAYGLTLGGGWKGIDITAFFQGAVDVKGYVQGALLGQVGTTVGKPTSAMLGRWTPTNTDASYPRLLLSSQTQNDASARPSSYWLRNASYVRLKNLQIGYTIPSKLTQRMGIQRVRVYYSGQNILTFSKFYKWVDPEISSGSGNIGSGGAPSGYDYPQVKVNTIGLNVTF